MKGLLLKDWYVLKKVGKSWLFFCFLYAVFAGAGGVFIFFALMNVMLSALSVKTFMAYEEQNHWDFLAVSLPVTRKQLVWEKYLWGLIFVSVSSLMTAFFMAVGRVLIVRGNEAPLAQCLLLCLITGVLVLAAELPVFFKLGVIKGRAWSGVGIVVIMGLMGGLGGQLMNPTQSDVPRWLAYSAWPVLIVLALAAGIGLFCSVRLSVRFYKNREL